MMLFKQVCGLRCTGQRSDQDIGPAEKLVEGRGIGGAVVYGGDGAVRVARAGNDVLFLSVSIDGV